MQMVTHEFVLRHSEFRGWKGREAQGRWRRWGDEGLWSAADELPERLKSGELMAGSVELLVLWQPGAGFAELAELRVPELDGALAAFGAQMLIRCSSSNVWVYPSFG